MRIIPTSGAERTDCEPDASFRALSFGVDVDRWYTTDCVNEFTLTINARAAQGCAAHKNQLRGERGG